MNGKVVICPVSRKENQAFDGGATLCHIGVVAFSHSPAHNGPTYDPSSDLSHDNTADT